MNPKLYIDYDFSQRDNLSPSEKKAEAGRRRAKHLQAIFILLKCADFERLLEEDDAYSRGNRIDELSRAVNNLGELGECLTDSIYCDIDSLQYLYNKQVEIAENASTLIDESEA